MEYIFSQTIDLYLHFTQRLCDISRNQKNVFYVNRVGQKMPKIILNIGKLFAHADFLNSFYPSTFVEFDPGLKAGSI